MKKDNLNNNLENDLDILKEIFAVLKLTNKYYGKLCKKYSISEIQFEVLYLLHMNGDNGIKMSTLGDKLGMARSGVTVLVDRMVLDRLVKRNHDSDDRRIIKIILTEKGKEIIWSVFPRNDIFNVSILDFMKQEEKELLYKLIIKTKERLKSKESIV